MARFARVVVRGAAHHVTQRGNGRQFLLASDSERGVYLDLLRQAVDLHGVSGGKEGRYPFLLAGGKGT